MKFSLEGKTAIITGGGSGIGKAIALTFAQQGASVYILDISAPKAENTVLEIVNGGGKARAIFCDVTDQKTVKEVISGIGAEKNIDILINNAGIAHIGNAENTAEEDFDQLFQVNIKGVYNCIHAAIPFMKEKGGVIINMASIAATVGIADRFAYSTMKGAVLTMTYSVAKDFISHGIRCNSISPARIHTPFVDGFLADNYPGREKEMYDALSQTQPIGRMGKPSEVADLALYLCSDEASFITGTDFPIDGGFIRLNS